MEIKNHWQNLQGNAKILKTGSELVKRQKKQHQASPATEIKDQITLVINSMEGMNEKESEKFLYAALGHVSQTGAEKLTKKDAQKLALEVKVQDQIELLANSMEGMNEKESEKFLYAALGHVSQTGAEKLTKKDAQKLELEVKVAGQENKSRNSKTEKSSSHPRRVR